LVFGIGKSVIASLDYCRFCKQNIGKRNRFLFVREFKQDSCGAAPYTFLGTAEYVSHIGSKPMNVVWKLHKEIPAKYLRKVQQVMG
jgi:hypothetical protein